LKSRGGLAPTRPPTYWLVKPNDTTLPSAIPNTADTKKIAQPTENRKIEIHEPSAATEIKKNETGKDIADQQE